MKTEARYYEKLPESKVLCHLCPNECIIKKGQLGECGVRRNKDGVLLAAGYGLCSSIHVDPIEKKPLYHYHPGSYILSVGSIGCNFHCNFCQNSSISQTTVDQYDHFDERLPEQLLEACRQACPNLGIAFTYNEPTVWYEFMMTTAHLTYQAGFRNVMVSNGYINEGPLMELIPVIHAFNIDLKGFSGSFYRAICKGDIEPVKHTLKTIIALGRHLEISYLVVPGKNDSKNDFLSMIHWIKDNLGPETVLHISRYFPAYKSNIAKTPISQLFDFCEQGRTHLSYVYIGNVTGSEDQNTFCAKCGKLVISRFGSFVQKNGIDEFGNCIHCNHKIVTY